MKILLALFVCAAALAIAEEREGNFEIRFEPDAILQTGVPIPFHINVKDALHKPLVQAKVTLQIELQDHSHTKVLPALAVSPGTYIAKPVFPVPGQWSVYVEVRRNDRMSSRTIQFDVPE